MVIYLAREYKNNFRTGKVKNFHTKEELQHFLKQSRDKGTIYRLGKRTNDLLELDYLLAEIVLERR